jgi:hypothetical protein
MGAKVFRLASHEDAVLDPSRIEVLKQSLGAERCREVVEEVVFHLTDRLTRLEDALRAQDVAESIRLATRLASLSEQVGLADFARVSRDLGACLDAGDPIATAAVAARLMRLAENSLFSVIVLTDQNAL